MGKIIKLKNADNTCTYPITKTEAIYLEDNRTTLKDYLDAMSITEMTESAQSVIINDAANNMPIKSLKIDIEPTQDLHGYNYPWIGGTRKNLLPNNGTTKTINGVTFTVNADGTITANGTATANAIFWFLGTSATTPAEYHIEEEVTLTGCPEGGSASTYRIAFAERLPNSIPHAESGDGITFTMAADTTACTCGAVIYEGYTANNVVFKPMIRLASDLDDTYEPYKNICPIDGYTDINMS